MKELKKDIRSGLSKSEAFERFSRRKGGDTKRASQYLAFFPSAQVLKKYSKVKYLLIGLYLLLAILALLASLIRPTSLSLGISLLLYAFDIGITVLIIYFIYIGNGMIYLLLPFLVLNTVVKLIGAYIANPSIAIIIFIAINTSIIILTLYLKTKLFPYQNFIYSKKDKKGNAVFE